MGYIRIGDKLVSREKIMRMVDKVLERRASGLSQQEVAGDLGLDRSFISRLETLGELRKGGKISLIGFPVGNKDELTLVAEEYGVDHVYLLTEAERWALIRERSGAELLNEIMGLLGALRAFDTVILIGSDMRIKLAEALVDKQIIPIYIGASPIREDKYVDPSELRAVLAGLRY
ncbi:MAG: transcriptional regulator [Firmicutes bacterium]|nr:transcriptional regulator [Dethiobacter sp.]MBS3888782.1 transcriptional regulator [Bacillota bacterium]